MRSLGIIGGGVLGRAIARGFLEHVDDVRVYDVVTERSTHGIRDAATADIVMLALPTPALPDGRCDTSMLIAFLEQAAGEGWWNEDSCYVIRSTTRVGFTQDQAAAHGFKLPLLHSPEFLTARCALTDFQIPARNIIGSPLAVSDPLRIEMLSPMHPFCFGWQRLSQLYEARFPGIPIISMHSNASELVKLACNSFFAAKVTLFNLFAELAAAHELDWDDVLGGILSDGRIAHAHTAVPGPDGKQGFGGQCLSKDLADLFRCCEVAGVDAGLLREVLERNDRIRRPQDELLARFDLSTKIP